MRSRFNGMGYMYVDDRCSGGGVVEEDIFGCKHCQAVVKRREWQESGAMCHNCDAPICAACSDRMVSRGCEVFVRTVQRALDKQYTRQQNERILGIVCEDVVGE